MDKLRMTLNVLQTRPAYGQTEPRWLLVTDQRPAGDGGFILVGFGLGFGDEFLLPLVIPAFISTEIQIAIGVAS